MILTPLPHRKPLTGSDRRAGWIRHRRHLTLPRSPSPTITPDTINMSDDLQLSAAEREVIRREFMSRFGEAASVSEGFLVKRWVTGPNKGRPKLTAAVQGMLDRGLITITDEGYWPRAHFTAKGLQALKRLTADRRALDPDRHRFLIDELAAIPVADPAG